MRNSPSRTLSRFVNFGYSGISPTYNKNTKLFYEMFSGCNARLALLKRVIAKCRLEERKIAEE
jgi:hypothetical protein